MDSDQLRLDPALLEVMRSAVTCALEHDAAFVAPAHLIVGLLRDQRVGPAIAALVPHDAVDRAAAEAARKLPEVAQVPEGALPDGERAPFERYETLAFRSRDGARTMYLDADALHIFIEGARRAGEVYRPKHLLFGFTAEAVKERALNELFGGDVQSIVKAVDGL